LIIYEGVEVIRDKEISRKKR